MRHQQAREFQVPTYRRTWARIVIQRNPQRRYYLNIAMPVGGRSRNAATLVNYQKNKMRVDGIGPQISQPLRRPARRWVGKLTKGSTAPLILRIIQKHAEVLSISYSARRAADCFARRAAAFGYTSSNMSARYANSSPAHGLNQTCSISVSSSRSRSIASPYF